MGKNITLASLLKEIYYNISIYKLLWTKPNQPRHWACPIMRTLFFQYRPILEIKLSLIKLLWCYLLLDLSKQTWRPNTFDSGFVVRFFSMVLASYCWLARIIYVSEECNIRSNVLKNLYTADVAPLKTHISGELTLRCGQKEYIWQSF